MNRNHHLFSMASLINGVSFSMILPLLAPLMRQLKLSELQAGAMVSAGALFMAIAAIYLSKHPLKYTIYQLLMIGFVGMSLTWALFSGVLMYGMTAHISVLSLFILLVIARATTGVFMAMPQIALQTYIMQHFQEEKSRSQSMAKFGALNSLGIIVGPFLTTLFLVGGLMTPLWIAVFLLIMVSVLISSTYDQERGVEATVMHSNHRSDQGECVEQHFSIRPILFWLGLGFYIYVAIVTLNLTAGFYLQDHFQIDIQQSAIYFSQCSLIVGISLVMMQLLIAQYLKWSVYQLLSVGMLMMGLGLTITTWTDHIRIFQVAYIFYGIAVACLMPAFTTGAAKNAPLHLQAKVAGWCTATQALSFVVGPLISTGLYQWQMSSPYYLLLIGLIILSGLLLIEKKRRKQLMSYSM